jgi:hypothetical protein
VGVAFNHVVLGAAGGTGSAVVREEGRVGYRARPTVIPKTIASRFVSAIPVRAFPEYEIRTVAVEDVEGTQRIALRDGWPAT